MVNELKFSPIILKKLIILKILINGKCSINFYQERVLWINIRLRKKCVIIHVMYLNQRTMLFRKSILPTNLVCIYLSKLRHPLDNDKCDGKKCLHTLSSRRFIVGITYIGENVLINTALLTPLILWQILASLSVS